MMKRSQKRMFAGSIRFLFLSLLLPSFPNQNTFCLAAEEAVAPIDDLFETASSATASDSHPTTITIKAAVLMTPPFAYEKKGLSRSINDVPDLHRYGGFQPHLLERLQVFAKQDDNIDLEFELETRTTGYDASIDLIANDCNTTSNSHPQEECQKYDMIIGDYWCSPQRFERVDFSPPWLRTTMSVMKYLDKKKQTIGTPDFTTLRDAFRAGAPVCALGGSIIVRTAKRKFPDATFLECPSIAQCIQDLKDEKCALYTDDELQLHYWASTDPSLLVTNEQFNTQYLFWPMSHALPPQTTFLFRKWIYTAVQNSTMDELYRIYFQAEVCPGGSAGKHCELHCDPTHGKADKLGNCVCESTRWTGDDCSIEVAENTNLIPRGFKSWGKSLFAVNCLFVLMCGAWLYYQRNTAQVKVSQPHFLALVLVGCLISSSTILVLGAEDSGDGPVPACMAIPWLYSVGFSITFGTLFAKIRRVYLIFKSASDIRREAVTWQETLMIICGVLIVDVTVLTVWTLVDPLTWKRTVLVADQFGYSLESYGLCDGWATFGSIIGTLHIFLLGIASYMCYVARDIPGDFSESKFIAMAMISNFQILLIGIPVLVLVGSDPSTSYFVRCTMVWMNDFMVVALIFGNLFYSVHFGVHSKTQSNVGDMIGTAMRRYTRRRSSRSEGSSVHRQPAQRRYSGLGNAGDDSTSMMMIPMDDFARPGSFTGSFTKSELEELEAGMVSAPMRLQHPQQQQQHSEEQQQQPARISSTVEVLPPIESVGSYSSSHHDTSTTELELNRDSSSESPVKATTTTTALSSSCPTTPEKRGSVVDSLSESISNLPSISEDRHHHHDKDGDDNGHSAQQPQKEDSEETPDDQSSTKNKERDKEPEEKDGKSGNEVSSIKKDRQQNHKTGKGSFVDRDDNAHSSDSSFSSSNLHAREEQVSNIREKLELIRACQREIARSTVSFDSSSEVFNA